MNILQNDLDTISSWAENWLMELNINKCSVLSITLKRIFIFHDNSILGATLRKGWGGPYLPRWPSASWKGLVGHGLRLESLTAPFQYR